MRPPQDSWPRGELHVDPRHAAGKKHGVGGVFGDGGCVIVLVALAVV